MKIGYISRYRDENGKETFVYREGNGTRRIGVRSDTVKVSFLYGTTPYKDIEENTRMMANGTMVLVTEPFFTDDAMREKMEKWCEWANSCEHREYSFFGEG